MSATLPVVTGLGGAVLGFVGAGGVRWLLDRRQELARAQGFARVVLDELRAGVRRLDPGVEGAHPEIALAQLATDAWSAHRVEIAGALLPEEFVGLATSYRAIAALNAQLLMASELGSAPPSAVPVVPQAIQEARSLTLSIVTSLAIPSIEWLAEGKVSPWRRRRAKFVMTPPPGLRCRCGHRWDHHRWSWESRGWWRVRWRTYEVRTMAHECHVTGCECSWFREPGAHHLPRVVQIRGAGRQAPHMPIRHDEDAGGADPRNPATAQPGASVSPEEHDAMRSEGPPMANC